jgi:hypothetical protein
MAAKIVFHQFDPVIYPRKVWIAKKATKEAILEHFMLDEEYLTECPTGIGCVAVCIPVINRETNNRGILCNVCAPRIFTTGDAAHEAVHIADYIFDDCGAYSQSFKDKNEPYAYLVGWVTDCFKQAK